MYQLDKPSKDLLIKALAERLNARDNFADFCLYMHKEDNMPFRHSKVHLMMCGELQKVYEYKTEKIMINMPPGHGKSELSSVLLTAFLLGHDPTLRIMILSYASDQSVKLSARIRAVMGSKPYRQLFPDVRLRAATKREKSPMLAISEKQDYWQVYSKNDPSPNSIGYVVSKGILSGTQGIRADIMILDDLYANRADAYSKATRQKIWSEFNTGVTSRLTQNIKGLPPRIIITNTRWHPEDVSGMIIRGEKGRNLSNWKIISLPAIAEEDDPLGREPGEALWPEVYSVKVMKKTRDETDITPSDWQALYQQHPVTEGGSIFRRDDWQVWTELSYRNFDYSVMSIDTALKARQEKNNDYHAITIWTVFRPPEIKLNWTQVVAKIEEQALSDNEVLLQFREHCRYLYNNLVPKDQDTSIERSMNVKPGRNPYTIEQLAEFLRIANEMTDDQIKAIRLGGHHPLFPLEMIKTIQSSDLELIQQFDMRPGRSLPTNLVRRILDDRLSKMKFDSFDMGSEDISRDMGESKLSLGNAHLSSQNYAPHRFNDEITWKQQRPYNLLLVKAWQDKCSYTELKKKVLRECADWTKYFGNPFDKIIIEDTADGPALMSDLAYMGIRTTPSIPTKDKTYRANTVSSMWEDHRVFGLGAGLHLENPDGSKGQMIGRSNTQFSAPVELAVKECEIFPNGEHDDLVDSITQAANFVKTTLPFKLTGEIYKETDDDLDEDKVDKSLKIRIQGRYEY